MCVTPVAAPALFLHVTLVSNLLLASVCLPLRWLHPCPSVSSLSPALAGSHLPFCRCLSYPPSSASHASRIAGSAPRGRETVACHPSARHTHSTDAERLTGKITSVHPPPTPPNPTTAELAVSKCPSLYAHKGR